MATSTPEVLPAAEAHESFLCNCWAYLRATYVADLPPMAELIADAGPTFGEIAVVRYPSGLYHFAHVTGQGAGYFTVDEANYEPCARTERRVQFSSPKLLGFVNLDLPLDNLELLEEGFPPAVHTRH